MLRRSRLRGPMRQLPRTSWPLIASRRGAASPQTRPRCSVLPPRAARRGRPGARAPGAHLRDRAGALLRASAADRTRLAASSRRHDRSQLRRHGEQRRGTRTRSSRSRGGRESAAEDARHQLAVPVPRSRRVQREADRADARGERSRHGAAGEQRLGGGRSRHPSGSGGHRTTHGGRAQRGVPRVDDGERCGHDQRL